MRREREGGRDQAHVAEDGQDQQVREETHRQPREHHRPRAAIVPNPESLGQKPETHREHGSAHELRDRAERQKQPHADIDMQESEQDNNGARESHWKEVGAKAGTRKTRGNYELRSNIPRLCYIASFRAVSSRRVPPLRIRPERSL